LPTPDPTDIVTSDPVVTAPATPNPTEMNIVTSEPVVTATTSTEPLLDSGELVADESEEPPTTPAASGKSEGAATEPECPDAWVLDAVYAEGDQVGAQGQTYICKEFPYTGKLTSIFSLKN
jgi:hypothetical protein